jgi:hypothetical protein
VYCRQRSCPPSGYSQATHPHSPDNVILLFLKHAIKYSKVINPYSPDNGILLFLKYKKYSHANHPHSPDNGILLFLKHAIKYRKVIHPHSLKNVIFLFLKHAIHVVRSQSASLFSVPLKRTKRQPSEEMDR